jgi:hypothetical protein
MRSTHSEVTPGNHKVFNAGKPEPILHAVDELKDALVQVAVFE